jgi:hypothetical protein
VSNSPLFCAIARGTRKLLRLVAQDTAQDFASRQFRKFIAKLDVARHLEVSEVFFFRSSGRLTRPPYKRNSEFGFEVRVLFKI